jgi:hypothetical protein
VLVRFFSLRRSQVARESTEVPGSFTGTAVFFAGKLLIVPSFKD